MSRAQFGPIARNLFAYAFVEKGFVVDGDCSGRVGIDFADSTPNARAESDMERIRGELLTQMSGEEVLDLSPLSTAVLELQRTLK
jgi:hypothetical protein